MLNDQEMKLNFSCPYSGDNYFNVDNGIDGIEVTCQWGTDGSNQSTSGSPITATVTIKSV